MSLVSADLYRFDDFELQPSRRVLLRGRTKIPIAPKTFEVLLCLVTNAGRVVLKEELLKTVWPESFVEESNLTQHIFWLRKALAEKANYIETIQGRGYEFTGPVQIVTEAEQTAAKLADAQLHAGAGIRVHLSSEQMRVVIESSTRPAPKPAHRRLALIVGAAAVAILAGGSWAGWHFTHRVVPGDHHEVVLADFENSTGDPDFDRALKTLLAMDLNQSPSLVVASDRNTKRVLKQMNLPDGSELPPAVAREVCERLNDQVVLSGLIARFGQKYLVTLTATECSTGKNLVETKAVSKTREGVINAVDSVASDMRRRLGDPMRALRPAGQILPQTHTFSLEALKLYAQGRELYGKAKFAEAMPFFKHAVQLDPNFTDAWSLLTGCYENMGMTQEAGEADLKAYQTRAYSNETNRLGITAFYEFMQTGDSHAAVRAVQEWSSLYPLQTAPLILLGNFQSAVGRTDLAIDALKRAIALDPTDLISYANLAEYQVTAGRLDDAKATCLKAFSRGFDDASLHHSLLNVAYLEHDEAAFSQQMNWFHDKAPEVDREEIEAEVNTSQGKLHSAVAHYLRQFDLRETDGNHEGALEGFSGVPLLETDVGLVRDAKEHFKRYIPRSPIIDSAQAAVTVTAAQLGELSFAERKLQSMHEKGKVKHDTDLLELTIPESEAAVDIAKATPELAIVALQPSEPHELSDPTVSPMRAKAYLAAKKPELAKLEFQTIIDHPYISAIAPDVPMAHLGLARAEEMEGHHVEARHEYQIFFDLWKDADSNLPLLRQAHLEYAKLK